MFIESVGANGTLGARGWACLALSTLILDAFYVS